VTPARGERAREVDRTWEEFTVLAQVDRINGLLFLHLDAATGRSRLACWF
jgi:hypothetical protein